MATNDEIDSGIFIPQDDGYTEAALIPELPGVHSRAAITYRPALWQEREAWSKAIIEATPAEKGKIDVALVKKHLRTVNSLPVKPEMIAAIRPKLFSKILDAIMGYKIEQEEADAKNS